MNTILKFQPTDWPFAMRLQLVNKTGTKVETWDVFNMHDEGRTGYLLIGSVYVVDGSWRWTTVEDGTRHGGGLNNRDMAVSVMFELRKLGKLKAFEIEVSLHSGALRWVTQELVAAILQYEEAGEDWLDLFQHKVRDVRSQRVQRRMDDQTGVDKEFKGLW